MHAKEKIRQFVIMARHPEAKSYEEAIIKEKTFFGCMLELDKNSKHYNSWCDSINLQSNIVIKGYCDSAYMVGDKNHYHCEYISGNNVSSLFKILGRPITAFDVCWALNKKYNPKNMYYFDLKPYVINNSPQLMIVLGHSDTVYFDIIKSNGTHTVLEDWSDKTCEQIVKLIDL
jgi:hypothetical protein